MGVAGFVTSLILLFIQFLGAMKLQTMLRAYSQVESLILVVGLIVSIIAIIGITVNTKWGWPLMLMVFSGSMANFIWLYTQTPLSFTIGISMLVAVISIMMAFVAVDLWEPDEEWEEETKKK